MPNLQWLLSTLILGASIAVALRAMLYPHREPATRLAWIIVIIAVPLAGLFFYLLVGEARISPRRRALGREIEARLPRPPGHPELFEAHHEDPHYAPFALARTVNLLDPTQGNAARLSADSPTAIAEMVADIDAASSSVHLCTYIWLDDRSGVLIKEALIRAAQRGVAVRALADALGARKFIRSDHWREMRDAGCDVRVALPVGNPLWTWIRGRVDLRNHRKLLILDNRVAWVGSQNIADPEFRIKPKFAPWVDIQTRWEGPVAEHCQFLFAADWMADGGDDLTSLLQAPTQPASGGTIIAQVIGTGPTLPFDAMPACIAELIHSARDELVVTTPYFVPDEQILTALTSAARRGVATTLILPQRNDSRIVAAVSRSHYRELLKSGVAIFEYVPGLLHSKTMVVDGRVALIGSANLDLRSFQLNFENNILLADPRFAAQIRERQELYLAQSQPVTMAEVLQDSWFARLWQNLLAMMSPVL